MLTGIVKLKTVQFKKFSKILSNDVVHYILKSSTFETKLPSNSYIFKKCVFSIKVSEYLPVWMYATVFYYICVRIYLRVQKETIKVFL